MGMIRKINFEELFITINDYIQPHANLQYLRITLDDPINNLEKLIKYTSNLFRLYLCGNLISDDILNDFKTMAQYLSVFTPHLQQIQYFDGGFGNHCYATDLDIYPHDNKYQIFPRPTNSTSSYNRYYDY
ncbi:unnamed protein product, partial [Adineta ricciae]